MNEVADILVRAIPPFFFHYIIIFIVIGVIMCVCVLKFKYLYWYSQPLTYRFTLWRFFGRGGGNERHRTSIMNPLSLGERCYNAVVYPFLHHVNHNSVRVHKGNDEDTPPPFERISAMLRSQRKDIEIKNAGMIAGDSSDTLRLILSQETFGLSAFIGIFTSKHSADGNINGVSVLTPRIMISFDSSLTTSAYRSVSVYMSEYLAWNKYMMSERESLELIETTEYIQKSREIAGEQTLYTYSEIPWFVIPFSTVYSYVFDTKSNTTSHRLGHGITVVPVSSANFAIFYSFVNEHTRDFRCCILNELTQLQSLVEHKLYRIHMLVLNEVRVIAVYVFTQSAMPDIGITNATTRDLPSNVSTNRKKRTKGNRIADLHEYVSKTSTALVKYLPPVIPPKYDAFGKRISRQTINTNEKESSSSSPTRNNVLRLISSIQHKSLCDPSDFLCGFQTICDRNFDSVMIDTLSHNYRIIDTLVKSESWSFISQNKWYYILYNAIIHEETVCKDILII